MLNVLLFFTVIILGLAVPTILGWLLCGRAIRGIDTMVRGDEWGPL